MAKFERTSTLPPIDTKVAQLGTGVDAIKRNFLTNLYTRVAKFQAVASRNDYYSALAVTVKHRGLSVGRVPDRPAARLEPALPRHAR
jgi:hypothetical protein